MRLIGREELIDDPRFATGAARSSTRLRSTRSSPSDAQAHQEEAMTLVSGVGVPAGAVSTRWSCTNDPTFEKRGIMQVMEHRERAVQDADLAGAGRRQDGADQSRRQAWPAQRRSAEHLARHRRR